MRPVIYPYKIGSGGAKRLAEHLAVKLNKQVRRVRQDSRTFVPKRFHKIINWGNDDLPVWEDHRIGDGLNWINAPAAVRVAQNKLHTFQTLQGNVPIPEWTQEAQTAEQWLQDGNVVLARTLLRSHSGNGIVIMETMDDFVQAPLYVKYKKKKKEFRVHVFNGNVIDVQEKRREREVERDDDQQRIRNRHNGWVFAREDIVEPDVLRDVAVRAVATLNLDFGAVDIIWNQHENQCYVLEINTAPGIEGTTLENYSNAILAAL